ncbi:hypothetical protein Tco_1273582 [Tanacetum coccineum]
MVWSVEQTNVCEIRYHSRKGELVGILEPKGTDLANYESRMGVPDLSSCDRRIQLCTRVNTEQSVEVDQEGGCLSVGGGVEAITLVTFAVSCPVVGVGFSFEDFRGGERLKGREEILGEEIIGRREWLDLRLAIFVKPLIKSSGMQQDLEMEGMFLCRSLGMPNSLFDSILADHFLKAS